MHIGLIADAYPPLRTSGAVQMRDLARALAARGHQVVVIVPSADQDVSWQMERDGAVDVYRLRAPRTKDVSYLRRTAAEIAMPYAMWRNLMRSPLRAIRLDGIAWYSPSIFFAPLVHRLRRRHDCRTYLIIRDIFPEWAADMGLIGRGPVFRFFRSIARRQYRAADTVGIQTAANRPLVEPWTVGETRCEVLENWLAPLVDRGCPIDLSAGPLRGRTIFVYAGNMGVAQGMGRLLDLATSLSHREDIGFAFVGRGSDAAPLRDRAIERGLKNVMFFDEIDPDAIAGLYAQADIGLVALDPRHQTHNIPGKFISYIHAGLPVLASINAGNDLIHFIQNNDVGRVAVDPAPDEFSTLALQLVGNLSNEMKARCFALARNRFSSDRAASQLIDAFSRET